MTKNVQHLSRATPTRMTTHLAGPGEPRPLTPPVRREKTLTSARRAALRGGRTGEVAPKGGVSGGVASPPLSLCGEGMNLESNLK